MSFFDPSFEARALRTGADETLPLELIESQLKVLLPAALRRLYENFSAAIVFDKDVVFPAPECSFSNEAGAISIGLILGPIDGDRGILRTNYRLRDEIPNDTIAFAELAGGNMLLFRRHSEEVFVWLHDEPLVSRAASAVSHNVNEFFSSLSVANGKKSRSLAELGLDIEAMGLKK